MTPLKLIRILRGFSQALVATQSGLSQTTYSRIERGRRAPEPPERRRIADAIGVPEILLFGSTGSGANEFGAHTQASINR